MLNLIAKKSCEDCPDRNREDRKPAQLTTQCPAAKSLCVAHYNGHIEFCDDCKNNPLVKKAAGSYYINFNLTS